MIENRLHVLVVDDDPTVRRSLERILSADSRLEVVQAEDGLAALRILESRPIDILISDESMPQINGVRLLQTVRARWPGTRRVLYTGHPHADVVLEAINRGGVDKALMKGVPLEQLRMELARRVKLRHVPELHFHYDDSVDRGERIEILLKENPPAPADE